MRLSAEGRDSLIRLEGARNTMYRDAAGLPTIGVGHLLTRDELHSGKLEVDDWIDWHAGLTDGQVDALFAHDVAPVESAVSAIVHVPLSQGQFDALCSFAFNVGLGAFRNSTLLKKLNAGQYDAVPAELRRWVYAAVKVLPGLQLRREHEIELWNGTV